MNKAKYKVHNLTKKNLEKQHQLKSENVTHSNLGICTECNLRSQDDWPCWCNRISEIYVYLCVNFVYVYRTVTAASWTSLTTPY